MNEVDYELTQSDAVIYKDYTDDVSLSCRTDDEDSDCSDISVAYNDDINSAVHRFMNIIYG